MNKITRVSPPKPRATPARPLPRVSERIVPDAVETPPDGSAVRHDGWTPERIRIFLETLALCGVVDDAARAAGMGRSSAYALRNRSNGRAFHLAWNAALLLARRRIADDLLSRAIHGCVEVITRDGEVWGERHRFDNRLAMAVLTRLDNQFLAGDDENATARMVAEEYDEFLDLVCEGGQGDAADFVARRRRAEGESGAGKEARLLKRLERYGRDGGGLDEADEPEETDDGPRVIKIKFVDPDGTIVGGHDVHVGGRPDPSSRVPETEDG